MWCVFVSYMHNRPSDVCNVRVHVQYTHTHANPAYPTAYTHVLYTHTLTHAHTHAHTPHMHTHTQTQLMTSIKTVLIEMLSTFEAKGRMGAKQLKEQLHSAWPIPDSTVALAHLRKELVEEMKQSLEVVRSGECVCVCVCDFPHPHLPPPSTSSPPSHKLPPLHTFLQPSTLPLTFLPPCTSSSLSLSPSSNPPPAHLPPSHLPPTLHLLTSLLPHFLLPSTSSPPSPLTSLPPPRCGPPLNWSDSR